MTVMDQRRDQADYAIARNTEWHATLTLTITLTPTRRNRLAQRSGLTGMMTSQNNVHPVLISEREMARLNQRFNPSVGLLYSTEGPLQERHRDDEILRSQGKLVQPSREHFGATGMSS